MKDMHIGFIGGGRITKIFLRAFQNKDAQFASVKVYETAPDVAGALKQEFPAIEMVDSAHSVARQEVLFIALHPPVIMENIKEIKDSLTAHSVVISLAPKISIEKIREVTGNTNIARMIPNATSFINEGYNPICFAAGFNPKMKQSVLETLELMGKTFEVEESKLEGYALISAMLPTYFWFQWQEIINIGEHTGLTTEESIAAVNQTSRAALKLLFDSGLKYEEVTDLIPVKPIGAKEDEIREIFRANLIGLFNKIKPQP